MILPDNPNLVKLNTINKVLDDIQVTSTPNSPLLISLLTTSNKVDIIPERPPIPPDLCEWIPENESLYDKSDPRAVPGVNWIANSLSNVSGLSSSFYPPDSCVQQYAEDGLYSQPGDLNYARCGIPEEIADLYATDWVAAAMSTPVSGAEGGMGGECRYTPSSGPARNMTDFRVLSISRSGVTFTPAPNSWPPAAGDGCVSAEIHMYRSDGGGGKFDWTWYGQGSKGFENIRSGYNGHRVPRSGEIVQFQLVNRPAGVRSNKASIKWP